MAEARQALVLHLAGGGEPVWVAVSGETAEELAPRLADLVMTGGIETVTAADGHRAVVNFHHVAFAMIVPPPPLASTYGNLSR